jgi:AcrR family transcriptional regulator
MARTYNLKRRAEQQAETRRRIVEAAVDLHSSIGPALTTFSMIAKRAGVQRHTLYAHFPDEQRLYLACSALTLERDPLPDPTPWREIADRRERLGAGLAAIYGWYERNAELLSCVLRDAEFHQLTKDIVAMRFGPPLAAYCEVLGADLSRTRAMLDLALSFFTWRTLVRQGGLEQSTAVAVMVRSIECSALAPSLEGAAAGELAGPGLVPQGRKDERLVRMSGNRRLIDIEAEPRPGG